MTSEIRTNTITSRAGLSTVTFTDSGPMFSGITTFVDNSTFSVGTGGTIHAPATNVMALGTNSIDAIKIDSSGNVNVTGILTASSISGGVSLTNGSNDRLVTATGASGLNGESNLTFDGSTLGITKSSDGSILQTRRTGNTSGGGAELKVTDGFSSTSPVYGFWYNSTTGIGNPAANTTSFIQAGSEKVRIESTGDVILKNNGGDNRIERDTTSGGPYLLFHNRGTGTTDNSGVYNLGGISAAGYRDVANPSIVGAIQFERQPTSGGASSGCDIVFRTGFNGTTSSTAVPEKMRLTYGGAVMINTTNSSSRTLNLKGTFGILSTSQTGVLDMSVTDAGEASIAPYVAGGSALIFKTNASGAGVAERLRITSNGHITAPNNVAFSARGGPADVTDAVIVFGTIVFQRGGTNYSTSTGEFTAPVDGIYHFMCNPYRYQNSYDSVIFLEKSTNGGSSWTQELEIRNQNNYNNDNGRGWFTLALSNLIDLNANDKVRIKASNRVHTNGIFSRFSGFLVA